jgi:hypothetical protein
MKSVGSYSSVSDYLNNLPIPSRISDKRIRDAKNRVFSSNIKSPGKWNYIIEKSPNTVLVRSARLKAAFPDSKFVIVYRDCVESVEGLRRKWPDVFGRAKLEEVCHFWETLHRVFLREVKFFRGYVFGISFNEFVSIPGDMLSSLAVNIGLEIRDTLIPFSDRQNLPGKGLRNVTDGQIVVAEDKGQIGDFVLTEAECEYIRKRLGPISDELRQTFG